VSYEKLMRELMDCLSQVCEIAVRGHLLVVRGLPVVHGHLLRFVANAT